MDGLNKEITEGERESAEESKAKDKKSLSFNRIRRRERRKIGRIMISRWERRSCKRRRERLRISRFRFSSKRRRT